MSVRPTIPNPCRALTVLAALCLMLMSAAVRADENEPLPELGDSATRILSPAQEERIGQQFLRKLLRDQSYVDDHELNAYLDQLGAKVAENASLRGTPITLHLLQHKDLNAFAVPGGYITFHTGLILATEDENELASVMGHEIAHISQRHLPRMLVKSEAGKLPAAAAILASIFVGGKAGLAGFTVANAALLANQLAYTRDFEREADAIGIQLLAKSGYDPTAMSRFFDKIDRQGGLGDEGPEFLHTPASCNSAPQISQPAMIHGSNGVQSAQNEPPLRTAQTGQRAGTRAVRIVLMVGMSVS